MIGKQYFAMYRAFAAAGFGVASLSRLRAASMFRMPGHAGMQRRSTMIFPVSVALILSPGSDVKTAVATA
jgi:hypothetical protein